MLSFILLRLTLQDVIAGIPHDAGAIVTYALLALFVGFVWAGSRSGSPEGAARRYETVEEETPPATISGGPDHDR